jgi:hypothetical protein
MSEAVGGCLDHLRAYGGVASQLKQKLVLRGDSIG